jgi:hypothetical protein
MVTYNVDESLARGVVFGLKASILKPHGKRRQAAVGDLLHICCGNLPPLYGRSERYHRLMVAPCALSIPVTITERAFLRDGEIDTQGHRLELMAQAEGFATYAALREHYDRMDGLPWCGQLLRWNPAQAEFRAQWPLIERAADDGSDCQ